MKEYQTGESIIGVKYFARVCHLSEDTLISLFRQKLISVIYPRFSVRVSSINLI